MAKTAGSSSKPSNKIRLHCVTLVKASVSLSVEWKTTCSTGSQPEVVLVNACAGSGEMVRLTTTPRMRKLSLKNSGYEISDLDMNQAAKIPYLVTHISRNRFIFNPFSSA